VCVVCGMVLSRVHKYNGDQSAQEGRLATCEEYFGSRAFECTAIQFTIPEDGCKKCLFTKLKTCPVLVALADAFCKINSFRKVAPGPDRAKQRKDVTLDIVRNFFKQFRVVTARVKSTGGRLGNLKHVTNVEKTQLLQVAGIAVQHLMAESFLLDSGQSAPQRILPFRCHLDKVWTPLNSFVIALQNMPVPTYRTIIGLANQLIDGLTDCVREIKCPTLRSTAILFTFSNRSFEYDERVLKWFRPKEIIKKAFPGIKFKYDRENATHRQTLAGCFVEALEKMDLSSANTIRSILKNKGDFNELLAGLAFTVKAIDPRILYEALEDPLVRTGGVACALRCDMCQSEVDATDNLGSTARANNTLSLWKRVALMAVVTRAFQCLPPGVLELYTQDQLCMQGVELQGLELNLKKTEDRRIVRALARDACIAEAKNAYIASALFRSRIYDSISAASVLTHGYGQFRATLPDDCHHRMSVMCTAASLGLFDAFFLPVLTQGLGKTTAKTSISSGVDETAMELSCANADFMAHKGNGVIDAVASMRLLQYAQLLERRQLYPDLQVQHRVDSTTTLTVPCLPVAFGEQRNHKVLVELITKTFDESLHVARHMVETTCHSFDVLQGLVMRNMLGMTRAHEEEAGVYSSFRDHWMRPEEAIKLLPSRKKVAAANSHHMTKDLNTFKSHVSGAMQRLLAYDQSRLHNANIPDAPVGLSGKWPAHKVAIGLFFKFSNTDGTNVASYPLASGRKAASSTVFASEYCKPEIKAAAVMPSAVRAQEGVVDDEQSEIDELNSLEDSMITLITGQRIDQYVHTYSLQRPSSPTRTGSDRTLKLVLGLAKNRKTLSELIARFFVDHDAFTQLAELMDHCDKQRLNFDECENSPAKLSTASKNARVALGIFNSCSVVFTFFFNKCRFDVSTEDEARMNMGRLFVACFLKSDDAKSDANWPRVLGVGLELSKICRAVDAATHRAESDTQRCLLRRTNLPYSTSIVDKLSALRHVVDNCRQLVSDSKLKSATKIIIYNKDQVDRCNTHKHSLCNRRWLELLKKNDETTRVNIQDMRAKEREVDINDYGGYLFYVSKGVLKALLDNRAECRTYLAAACSIHSSAPGSIPDTEIDSLYMMIVRMIVNCHTNLFDNEMETGFYRSPVVVHFLVTTALAHGDERERTAAVRISASGMCYLTGRMNAYAYDSLVRKDQMRTTAGAGPSSLAQFDIDNDELFGPYIGGPSIDPSIVVPDALVGPHKLYADQTPHKRLAAQIGYQVRRKPGEDAD
jgi:hypothetical protein